MITSRRKKNFGYTGCTESDYIDVPDGYRDTLIFPKGGWEEDETASKAAIRETWEEAGVTGDIIAELGSFYFESKRAKKKGYAGGDCICDLFLLKIHKVMDDWPEARIRKRKWLRYDE